MTGGFRFAVGSIARNLIAACKFVKIFIYIYINNKVYIYNILYSIYVVN